MPETRYTVSLEADNKYEIFMSAGLIRNLVSKIQGPDDVGEIFMNAELQEDLFKEVLSDRDELGKVKDMEESVRRLNKLDPKEATALLEWLGDHILDFFISGVKSVTKALEMQEKATESLMASLDGMKDSQSEKPSAGASESDQAA